MPENQKKEQGQSQDQGKYHIGNAEKIIQSFGGIRPMATKLGVPVTTVQGWKKRNVIPANRLEVITTVAKENKIELGKLSRVRVKPGTKAATKTAATKRTKSAAASKTLKKKAAPKTTQKSAAKKAAAPASKTAAAAAPKAVPVAPKPEAATPAPQIKTEAPKAAPTNTAAELKAMSDRAVKKSMMFTGSLVAIAVVVGFVMFGKDDVAKVENEIGRIQENVGTLEGRTALLERVVPKNLDENLKNLKDNTTALRETVGELAQNVQAATASLSEGDTGSVLERIGMLEQQVGQLGSGDALQALMGRIDGLSSTLQGQQELGTAMEDLSSVVQGLQGQMDGIDAALERAKKDNDELAKALEGVNGRDLGAAAMLLALGQFRNSVNRNAPFEDDLAILHKIVGDEDEELNAALDRLAPYAAEGVLTPEGLQEELKSISGDIIMAKLAGEDVSFQDRALQRLGEVIEVSKDGESLTDTAEAATVARAQELLDKGDVEGAMKELQTLEGPAAEAAQPWMNKAEGNLAAQGMEAMILQSVLGKLSGSGGMPDLQGMMGGATGATGAAPQQGGAPMGDAMKQGMQNLKGALQGGGQVYSDPASGMHILKKNGAVGGGTPWPMDSGQ